MRESISKLNIPLGYPRNALLLLVGVVIAALVTKQVSTVALLMFFLIVLVKPSRGDRSDLFNYLLPGILLLGVFSFFPLSVNIILSLFRVNGSNLSSFNWSFNFPTNFLNLLDSHIDIFALLRSAEFAFMAVLIEMLLGIAVGYMISGLPTSLNFVRIVFLMPVLIPPLVAGMLWRSIFDQSFGLANKVTRFLGGDGFAWLTLSTPGIIDRNLESLLNIRPGLACSLVAEIWQWTPFIAVAFAATLRTMPRAQIEWARTQGGGSWRVFKAIYLPYCAPVIGFLSIVRLIDCLKTYESVWCFFGNNSETATTSIRIATYATEVRNFGAGAALSLSYLVLVSILFLVLMKYLGDNRSAH